MPHRSKVPIISSAQPFEDPSSSAVVDRVSDQRWLVRVWVVVALFVAVTVGWSIHVGVPIRDPHGSMFVHRVMLSISLFLLFVVIDCGLRARRADNSRAEALRRLRTRWTGQRSAVALSGLLAYHIVYLCYHNLKSWVAFRSDQDADLLRFDRWLLHGHSPAVLLHDVLGQNAAAVVLAIVYESFSYLVPASFVAAVVFPEKIREGYVFLMSAMWTWILGTLSYYLIVSSGPFYSAPQEFAGLRHTFIVSRQERLVADRAHLLLNPAASDAFASISAFASLHVGFTFMILLMARYYRMRRTVIAMSVYLVLIIVSTIYFGYHFLPDDVAGLVLGWLAVVLGRLTIHATRRPVGPASD